MEGDFKQADALVRQLMERIGGSASAYSEPQPGPASGTEVDQGPSNPVLPEGEEEVCATGIIQSLEDIEIHPPPLDESYAYHSVVEDSPALKAIYQAFRQAISTGQNTAIEIGLYAYAITRGPRGEWVLVDTAAGLVYRQELDMEIASFLTPVDTLIWVAPQAAPQASLGYIHEGYVFMKTDGA